MGHPNASAFIRKDRERPELKHLSKGQEKKSTEMSLVEAIEHDRVKPNPAREMWCNKPTVRTWM